LGIPVAAVAPETSADSLAQTVANAVQLVEVGS
jgi:hypothetical protein